MPKDGVIIRARIAQFAMSVVETCPVVREGNPAAESFRQTIWNNCVSLDVEDLQRRMVRTAMSDDVRQEAAILRYACNINCSRDPTSAQSWVNQDDILSEYPVSHDDGWLFFVFVTLQKEIAVANVPGFGDGWNRQELTDPLLNSIPTGNSIEMYTGEEDLLFEQLSSSRRSLVLYPAA